MSLRHNYTENKKKRKKKKGKRFPPPSCQYLRDPSLEIPLLEFSKRNRSKRFGTTVGRISTTAEQIRATVPGTGIVRLSRGYRYTLRRTEREREKDSFYQTVNRTRNPGDGSIRAAGNLYDTGVDPLLIRPIRSTDGILKEGEGSVNSWTSFPSISTQSLPPFALFSSLFRAFYSRHLREYSIPRPLFPTGSNLVSREREKEEQLCSATSQGPTFSRKIDPTKRDPTFILRDHVAQEIVTCFFSPLLPPSPRLS